MKQLAQAIVKDKDLSIISKYDVCNQPSMNDENNAAYSPTVDVPRGNEVISKTSAKTAKAKAKKNGINGGGDGFIVVSMVATLLLFMCNTFWC